MSTPAARHPGSAVVADAYTEALAAARSTRTSRLAAVERRLRRRYARRPLTIAALVRFAAARTVLAERGIALRPLPARTTGAAQ